MMCGYGFRYFARLCGRWRAVRVVCGRSRLQLGSRNNLARYNEYHVYSCSDTMVYIYTVCTCTYLVVAHACYGWARSVRRRCRQMICARAYAQRATSRARIINVSISMLWLLISQRYIVSQLECVFAIYILYAYTHTHVCVMLYYFIYMFIYVH